MRKTLLTTVAAALVMALVMVPGIGLATVFESGLAYMIWDSPTFESSVNWIIPPPPDVTGADTRSSFSGLQLYLNGEYYDDGAPVDGFPWATTGLSTTLADGFWSVNGQGYTTPSLGVQEAISSITIGGYSTASVDIAQAALRGQFTVPTTMPLFIMADYLLQMSLFNTNAGDNSYVDVSVGLTVSDFANGTYASDSRLFSLSLAGAGSNSFSLGFGDLNYIPLQLANYDLVPGITYDFEAQASTIAYATSVPEPLSLILLASGLSGLAIFRKQFA